MVQINEKELSNKLKISLTFDKSLIRESDLGAFKHKHDEGQNMRLAAFNFLNSLVDFFY